jgi:asparagine synthase (glutamine-hydrolysing)
MCGLVAIFGYAGDGPPVDRDELLAIRDAMAARGPDGAGSWISSDRRVGLAHRRLSLLDLSAAGAQPMASEDGSLQIVFNGEIYNYRELRGTLEGKGFHFRSSTDTEVLLNLYADRGPEMLHELRGMYALAIWDARNRRLFAARDPLGIKPLYYADSGKTLRLASQVKALLAGGAISSDRDPAGEAGFLLLGYVPEPFTIYRNIHELPAGAYLIAEQNGRPSMRSFCRIEEKMAAAEAFEPNGTSKNVRERLRTVLADSVRRHLIADVPVGVFLSAGLDSSVITALAAESPGADLRTITLGFNEYRGSRQDETLLAGAVAETYATRHQTRWVSRRDFEVDFERVLATMDQPSIDGINTYFVAKAAHEAGLRAALSGIGGDELFSGYPSFEHVPRVAKLPAGESLRRLGRAARAVSAPLLSRITSPKYAGMLEYAGSWSGAYLLRRALFMPWEIPQILPPEIAHEGLERLGITRRLEDTVRGIGSHRLRVSALETVWYMRNQLLRDSDWAGMAHSVEIRTPFADLEVLRVVAPLAAHGRLRAGKRDLAELPIKGLPRAIVERCKTGFAVPVSDWTSQIDGRIWVRGLRGWAMRLARKFEFDLRDGGGSEASPLPNEGTA